MFLRTVCALFVLAAIQSFAQERPIPVPPNVNATIGGAVVDENNVPVVNAKVHADLKGLPMAKAIQYVESNERDRFVIPVHDYGTYYVSALKEKYGYPDTGWGFYSGRIPPTVEITSDKPNATITVKLGPKAGILVGTVSDAVSGKPLPSGFMMRWANNPQQFIATSASPSFRVLVPPNRDISLEVTSPGYKKWSYKSYGSSSALNVQSGAELNLDILLEPSPEPNVRGSRYLIPDGYVGWAKVDFDVKDAPPAPLDSNMAVLKVASNGALKTSSPMSEIGAAKEYLFYSPDGTTRPVPQDYWHYKGLIWGEREWVGGGERNGFQFFVGTEKQFLKNISPSERRFFVIEHN